MDAYEYDEVYREGSAPWQIGRPQPALEPVLAGEVRGPKVLDVGCGTGDLAIALARRGFDVTGVDISAVAIDKARAKAAAEGLKIHFEVQDATRLSLPEAPFQTIFDSGLLHSLYRIGPEKAQAYLALLPGLAAPGAAVFVVAISAESADWALTEESLRADFAPPGWTGTRVEPIEIRAEPEGQFLALQGFLVRTMRA